LCLGDFNEIADLSEKAGVTTCSLSQMERFCSVLADCSLGDLGFKGSKITWANKRDPSNFIKERLDRALATGGWCEHFLEVVVEVLPTRSSDHKPLNVICKHNRACRGRQKSFKYEASWGLDEECGEVVSRAWEGGQIENTSLQDVRVNLDSYQVALSKWSGEKFGHFRM
jgi:hypothetical protein